MSLRRKTNHVTISYRRHETTSCAGPVAPSAESDSIVSRPAVTCTTRPARHDTAANSPDIILVYFQYYTYALVHSIGVALVIRPSADRILALGFALQSTLGNSNLDNSNFSISRIIQIPLQITITLNVK